MNTKSENLDESETKDLVKNLPKRDTVPFSFRMDRELKHEVEQIFDQMGVSMSGALNMFLAQVVVEQGMPFRPKVQIRTKKPTKNEDPLDNIDYMTLDDLCAEL